MITPPTPSRFRAAGILQRAWLRMDFFGGDPGEGSSSQAGSSPAGSALTSTIFSQSFFAFLLAALLFDQDVRPVPYVAANLSLSTLLVGIGALADPQRAMRRRRADAALLLPAPLQRGTVAVARALHGTFYTALITVGMAIPPAILCHWVYDGSLAIMPLYVLTACVLSALCAGTVAVGLRIVERLAGAGTALLFAGTFRALLLGGGLVGFALCLRHLDDTAAAIPLGPESAWAWPPYHAARLLAPGSDPVAASALTAMIVLVVGFGLLLPESSASRSAGERSRRANGLLARLERAWTDRHPPLLGATRFVATMLYRSPSFRARVLPLVGVPLAMTGLTFADADPRGQRLLLGMTLQFPAIYLPFLIAFLPNAERPGSGHVFSTAPGGTGPGALDLAREASLVALTTRVLSPILLATFLLGLSFSESPILIATTTAFAWGSAVWIATWQLRALPSMPFTLDATEQHDADFGNLMGSALVLAALGGAFALFAQNVLVAGFGLFVAASAAWRLTRAPFHVRVPNESADPTV